MSVKKNFYGKMDDGREVNIFSLVNSNGMEVEITNFGGVVTSIKAPDRNGKFEEVTLGYGSFEDYLINAPHFGGIIGRFGNRIEKGEFELNGVEYKLAQNDGNNHLHGGWAGFDKVLWDFNIVSEETQDSIELFYLSRDGEEGYPGNLEVKVIYTLTDDNSLEIRYLATTDKDTIINLTNHTYFNLSGNGAIDILNHILMINADKFTPTNEYSIPTGEIRDVKGTPMDFSKPVKVGEGIEEDYDQLKYGNGYDHNYVLNINGKELEMVSEVYEENSGRVLEVFTNKPGIQFYSGNYLDKAGVGKNNVKYEKRTGLCLETQFYPDAINKRNFPSPILKAGEKYDYTTIYKFSAK